jgi:UDP-2-acetamido-3-amino-2,3-dideoxy-glucuronate N-acetyltransferase
VADTVRIHDTAVVEAGAHLAAGAAVWHHAHVRAGAEIGPGTSVGKNAYVDAGVRIGARCKIQNNVSVYAGVTLEDEVFVGPSAVFTNDRFPRAVSPGWEVVPTLVRRGASIGANATLVCGIEVGEWATVGAGSVVTRSLAAHELVVGNPARRLGWVCRCGRVASRDEERPADVRCERCRAAEEVQ